MVQNPPVFYKSPASSSAGYNIDTSWISKPTELASLLKKHKFSKMIFLTSNKESLDC